MHNLPTLLTLVHVMTTESAPTSPAQGAPPLGGFRSDPAIGVVIVTGPPAPAEAPAPTSWPDLAPIFEAAPVDPLGPEPDDATTFPESDRAWHGGRRFAPAPPHPAWVAEVRQIVAVRYGDGRTIPGAVLESCWQFGHAPDMAAEEIGTVMAWEPVAGFAGWTPHPLPHPSEDEMRDDNETLPDDDENHGEGEANPTGDPSVWTSTTGQGGPGHVIRSPYHNARGNVVILVKGCDGLGNVQWSEGEAWPRAISQEKGRPIWGTLDEARAAIDRKYGPNDPPPPPPIDPTPDPVEPDKHEEPQGDPVEPTPPADDAPLADIEAYRVAMRALDLCYRTGEPLYVCICEECTATTDDDDDDAPQDAPAPTGPVKLTGIVALLDRAAEKLSYPKIRMETPAGSVVLSRAGSKSRTPGAVSVTNGEPYGTPNSYYGRIDRDGSHTVTNPAVRAILGELATDPATVAARYGKASGDCCFCGRPLTNGESGSVDVGYGPTCAKKWGLPWDPNGKTFAYTAGKALPVTTPEPEPEPEPDNDGPPEGGGPSPKPEPQIRPASPPPIAPQGMATDLLNTPVTIYVSGGFMGNIQKYQGKLQDFGVQKYAQYEAAPFFVFIPQGKRKAQKHSTGYKPFFLILKGHGHPEPAGLFIPTGTVNGMTTEHSRYMSHDPRWETGFNAMINPYLADHPGLIIADCRWNKDEQPEPYDGGYEPDDDGPPDGGPDGTPQDGPSTPQDAVTVPTAPTIDRTPDATQATAEGGSPPPSGVFGDDAPQGDQPEPEPADDLTERIAYYRAYKAARVERYQARAAKARAASDSAYRQSGQIVSHIPMGQPILVGHHSEKRHRRDLERADNAMRRSVQEQRKAAYWTRRADSAESNDAIRSDDPEAVTMLRAKLATLEANHARKITINKAHKAYLKNPATLDRSDLSEKIKEMIRTYKPAYSWEPHPFPPYSLSNGNANIRRVRERIEAVARKQALGSWESTWTAPDRSPVVLQCDGPADRLRIHFPGKPDEATRTNLKRNGFRWAPSEGAWQKNLNAYAKHQAETLLTGLGYAKAENETS